MGSVRSTFISMVSTYDSRVHNPGQRSQKFNLSSTTSCVLYSCRIIFIKFERTLLRRSATSETKYHLKTTDIINSIRSGQSGRERVVRALLDDESMKNGIYKIVKKMGGSEDEAADVVNLTMVQFLKTVMKITDFKLNNNINSYLFGIARNIYLQMLRKNSVSVVELEEHHDMSDNTGIIDLKIIQEEKHLLLHKILDRLGTKCREVLMYWAAGYKMAEIAKILDYSSDVVVRRKKMNCMRALSKYLDENDHIKALLAS